MSDKPSVLIGCERSGIVRDTFTRFGWNAASCDLFPCERDGRNHLQMDVYAALTRFKPDLFICHPPCTFLTVSGMHWTIRGLRDPQSTDDAIKFAEDLWNAACATAYAVAFENPVGVLSTRSTLGKPQQYIQPYEFGDDASKKTGLWLYNLPLLPKRASRRVQGRMVEWPKGSGKMVERWANQTDSGQNKLGPSEQRAADRARTYPGIAAEMACTWTTALQTA